MVGVRVVVDGKGKEKGQGAETCAAVEEEEEDGDGSFLIPADAVILTAGGYAFHNEATDDDASSSPSLLQARCYLR